MYKKILCLIGMFLLSVQCIIINYPIKKEKKDVAVLSKYENIYDDFYYLKSLEDVNVLEIKNENGVKGLIEVEGNAEKIKDVLNKLRSYKIIKYNIEKEEKKFSVLLDIKKE
ncbi:hypothetical protein HMPREF1092_01208 [Clostridium thermobutyricum]|uniref:Uncharacterized protein n=1 Tax=Clostridium thermobutyricum TaxID=29372 RepID=N9XQH9_9CLOT|nr:hypothetical protein [Clostridium thermobutyricum]ENZ01973.1 hypothetical protein HMPREF1092_01208 [Clostridium thermobutyricum]